MTYTSNSVAKLPHVQPSWQPPSASSCLEASEAALGPIFFPRIMASDRGEPLDGGEEDMELVAEPLKFVSEELATVELLLPLAPD